MNNYFAKNLKFLREKKGYSQQKVAEELNVPYSTLSCWENGIRQPKIEKINEIANYFNVGLDIVSTDYTNNDPLFNELDILFSKNKEYLTEDDKETIRFIIEKRKREIDKELGKE